jgi:hypothetical protein
MRVLRERAAQATVTITSARKDASGLVRFLWLFGPGLLTVLPLWSARYLPFADLPEHAAVSAALVHWNDPAWRIREYFSFEPTITPYWLYDLLCALIAKFGLAFFGERGGDAWVAHKLLLSTVGVSLPFGAASWLRSLGRDPRLGAFACVLFWTKSLHFGLLPFVASLPIFLFGIAHYTYFLRHRRQRILHGCLTFGFGIVLTLLHVTTFVAFALALVGAALTSRSVHRPSLWKRPLPLLSGLLFASYTLSLKHEFETQTLVFLPIRRLLEAVPEWSFNAWGRRDEKIFAAIYWLGYLGVYLTGYRKTKSGWLHVMPFFAVCVVLLILPFSIGAGVFLNVRMAPILGVLLLPMLRLGPTRLARSASAAVLLGIFGQVFVATAGIRNAQKSLGAFDRIVMATAYGSRIMVLPFEAKNVEDETHSWAHMGAAIRVARGGLSQFSFTGMSHWPLHDKVSPKKPAPFWDHKPCWFDPDKDPEFFDVLLVRGAYDPFFATGDTERHAAGKDYALTVAAPPFYLWQRMESIHETPWSLEYPAPTLEKAPCEHWGSSSASN